MECNKEEALRAKDISLKKLEAKDFSGARKFALKAQQLYPEMENIAQMICVCDVHCSAESKMYGSESDWYGILQIEHNANDILIKKQYRKFALLLHPDKNKFTGAEAAFKLIGEAQRVLLDTEKRKIYDMKCKTAYKPVRQTQQASRNLNVSKAARAQNNVSSNSNSHVKGFNFTQQEQKKQPQSEAANGKETFWTQCPFCAVRYQYYKDVLNRALRCQHCKKPFIAYDMLAQGTRPGSDATQPVFSGQNIPTVNATGAEAVNEKRASNDGFPAGKYAEPCQSQKSRQTPKGPNKVDVEQTSKPPRNLNGKRGKKHEEESSESFGSESSLETEEIETRTGTDSMRAQQFDSDGDCCTRRSSRNKRHVSYNEDASDDEHIVNPSKKAKESVPFCPPTEESVDASEKTQQPDPSKIFASASASASASLKESKGECSKLDGSENGVESTKKGFESDDEFTLSSSHETTPEPTFYEYPDPEFSDFDILREEQYFKFGQVWAAYDTADAMPRFYAKVRKVFSPGFKLEITWLEANPADVLGKQWVNSELPISCGRFKHGDSEITEDRLMFSHEVYWDKGGRKDSVLIYPQKGETWAIFKNWDAEWYLIPESDRKFGYEFVEILSDYDETVGIRVAQLGKLKGFVCLFCRKGESELQIPPAEVLKFSHRVPSFRMCGIERDGVPEGSFELDPASITTNLEEITPFQSNGNTCFVDISNKEVNPGAKAAKNPLPSYCDNGKGNKVHVGKLNSDVNAQAIPDPEFFNFDDLKSFKKFELDQVWALYSDIDGLPKYYGIIKNIDHLPQFKVQIAWLEACTSPADLILWKVKEMPISCGQFKIKSSKLQTYTGNSSFSHQVCACHLTARKNVLAIYPRKGEIWALYKNWNASMVVADLQNCDYEIVEVQEVNSSHIIVLFLERVTPFYSVFKPQPYSNTRTREISRTELLRFSHQIPSFRLTNEKGGSLRGCWELDPAAFPTHSMCKL